MFLNIKYKEHMIGIIIDNARDYQNNITKLKSKTKV